MNLKIKRDSQISLRLLYKTTTRKDSAAYVSLSSDLNVKQQYETGSQ